MSPNLKITSYVINRLKAIRSQCSGCLYGIMYDSTLLVVGFNLETSTDSSSKSNYSQIQNNFPTEVYLCGLVKFGDCSDTQAHLKEILLDVDVTDNPLLLNCSLSSTIKASFFIHGKLEDTEYEVVNEEYVWREFVHIRLQVKLRLVCENKVANVSESMMQLRKKMASGIVSFNFPKTQVFLMGAGTDSCLTGLSKDSTVGELFNLYNSSEEDKAKSKKKKNALEIAVMRVGLVMKVTKESSAETLNKAAVKMSLVTGVSGSYLQLPLCVDALSMVHRNTKVMQLYDMLVESICSSLRLMENNILDQISNSESELTQPIAYHFLPADCGHFFTFYYPQNMYEKNYVEIRRLLHQQLALPIDRPQFRRANAYVFNDDVKNAPLVNVHEGLSPQVKDGQIYTVYGKYSYHHYMQDNFDDEGWGCAYRSLQTLVSWFRWQGYTDHPIPSHVEIQKCLVDLGDKPHSFIGSKQWIGSTEVSFCLESMLDVTSRIIFVNNGEELKTKGSDLSLHFQTNGTPIMIGGGALAHTILGVDYNRENGDIRFLILDPHYTGNEDLSIIQSKGWCSWKGIDFWRKTAYYNMCLPQRPRCI